MSWFRENSLNYFQRLALYVVKSGKVPRHVGFIMDGNRRYARKTKVEKSEGHSRGFDKLAEVLKWCLDLGIMQVTVYAFSIENFKRNPDEVSGLMNLATEKFQKLLEEKDKLMEEGVRIRVIGDLSRLPDKLVKLIAEAVCMTRNNKRGILSVALPYTSTNEITEAVRCVVKGIEEDRLKLEDISTGLIERCMYTEDEISPDLIIRTSGEKRLSDFMLWQGSCSCIYFAPVLWPEFTLWELLKAVFHYQRSCETLKTVKEMENNALIKNERVEKFLSAIYEERFDKLKAITCGS